MMEARKSTPGRTRDFPATERARLGLCVALLLALALQARGQIPGLTATPLNFPGDASFTITAGPDGNIWFVDFQANTVDRLTPAGAFTGFPVPSASAGLSGITSGRDGNLWFTEFNTRKVGRITTAGVITEFTVLGQPLDIVATLDGNLWFSEGRPTTKLGRIAPDGKGVAEYVVGGNITHIAAGPDGNVWFSDANANKIAELTVTSAGNTVTPYTLPSPNATPPGAQFAGLQMAAGLDGNLWFTHANNVGAVTPDGTITEFPMASSAIYPSAIVFGNDGNIWFTEYASGKVAQLVLSSISAGHPFPTINESDVVSVGLVGLILLRQPPPAGAQGSAIRLAREAACPATTYIARSTLSTGQFWDVTVTNASTCADLVLTIAVVQRGKANDGKSGDFEVRNFGPDTATGIKIRVLEGSAGLSSTDPTVTCQGRFCTRPQLDKDEVVHITVVSSTPFLFFNVNAYSATPDPDLENNKDEGRLGLYDAFADFAPAPASPPPKRGSQ